MHEDLLGTALAPVLTRLTILELPEESGSELVDDLVTLLTFESGNSSPAVIDNGAGGSLVWRGYVTGGLGTLYEQVAPLADRHGLSALIADERLEVHVAGGSEKVLVIGPLTDTMEVSRWLWEQRVERALEPDELAQWFVFDRIRDDADQLLQALPEDDDAWPASPRGDEPAVVDYAPRRRIDLHPAGELRARRGDPGRGRRVPADRRALAHRLPGALRRPRRGPGPDRRLARRAVGAAGPAGRVGAAGPRRRRSPDRPGPPAHAAARLGDRAGPRPRSGSSTASAPNRTTSELGTTCAGSSSRPRPSGLTRRRAGLRGSCRRTTGCPPGRGR